MSNKTAAASLVLNKLNTLTAKKAPVAKAPEAEYEKTEFWINVGYPVTYVNEDNEEVTEFIGLNLGIPLDRVKHMPVKSQNARYNALMAAKNNLLDQLLAAAGELSSGESVDLPLSVELRRIKSDDDIQVISDSDNPFLKKIF